MNIKIGDESSEYKLSLSELLTKLNYSNSCTYLPVRVCLYPFYAKYEGN